MDNKHKVSDERLAVRKPVIIGAMRKSSMIRTIKNMRREKRWQGGEKEDN